MDLHIREGEFLILLGPSGCGKSTILKLIAGLEDVSAGDIYLGDRRITFLPVRQRDVAMVFQNYALYPHMTVRDNIGFPLRMTRVRKHEIQERVSEVSRTVRLGDLLDRYPSELSGGQRQRVAVARAIIRHPKAFLLDEPLSNLDARLRADMRDELRDLHRRLGTTMVYVTHDQVEAMTMGSRVAVMRDGHLLQVGTPQEVYDRPVDTFVAGFLGSPPMNLLVAAPTRAGTGPGLCLAGRVLALPKPLASAVSTRSGMTDEVLVGIRPEDLRITDHASSAVHGQVHLVETVGSDAFATVDLTDGSRIRVRVSGGMGIGEGQMVSLGFDWDRVRLFDTKGQALSDVTE